MIRHCKICGQAEFGPLHVLERELSHVMSERAKAETLGNLELAYYWVKREAEYRHELFAQIRFSEFGCHSFETEDNLTMIERLAEERGLV